MHDGDTQAFGDGAARVRLAGKGDLADVLAVRGLRREDHGARDWQAASARVAERLGRGRYYAVLAEGGDIVGVLGVHQLLRRCVSGVGVRHA